MNSTELQPFPWSRGRWLVIIGLVLVLQLGLILWLEDHSSVRQRPPLPALIFHLADKNNDELLALNDPALLALPNRHGFSSAAWLKAPQLAAVSFDWTEPLQWLEPRFEALGESFRHFMSTNKFEPGLTPSRPEIELPMPQAVPLVQRTQSIWRLEGELAQWRMVSAMNLPSWPSEDILTNTVVQILVDGADAAGKPVSAGLLPPGSGSVEADRLALDLARSARFQPPGHGADKGFTWGRLIFEWNTLPK